MSAGRSVWQSPPARVGTVIVGGGITGLALLARPECGPATVLLESHQVGWGASGRNAGFLMAGVAANYERAAREHGREVARQVWAFTSRSHRLLAQALKGRGAGYARRGSWTLPESGEEAASLESAAEMLREDGFEARWRTRLPPPLAARPGGLLAPGDGEVDPVKALAALASRAPGAVYQGIEVTALEAWAGGVRLEAGGGEILAERAVLATNAYLPLLIPSAPVRPVRAQMLATEPCPRLADRPAYSGWGHRYWRQVADGRLLAGGFRDAAVEEEVGYGLDTTAAVQARLDGHLAAIGAGGAVVTRRWAGTMGFTPDGLPVAGPVPGRPNLFVAGGYTGHGMGFAVACAEVVAGLLKGRGAPPQWLDPARFPW
ncbi:MAG: NAD(P)/FAD-dependent oxidoreductase [Candidatus Dormibacterales bacterium]